MSKTLGAHILVVDLPVQVAEGKCLIRLMESEMKAGAVASQQGNLSVIDLRLTGCKVRGENLHGCGMIARVDGGKNFLPKLHGMYRWNL